jgi:hypothetical protein
MFMSEVPLFTLKVASPPADAIPVTNARASGVERDVRTGSSTACDSMFSRASPVYERQIPVSSSESSRVVRPGGL